jgi:hypothetical protein
LVSGHPVILTLIDTKTRPPPLFLPGLFSNAIHPGHVTV